MAIDALNRAVEMFGTPLYVFHEIVHNRHVVERFRNKGVVFVGVMSEIKREDAAPALEKHKLTWRNWVDVLGQDGVSPTAKSWGVSSIPNLIVLDREGKFRCTHVGEREELEQALDSLLAEQPVAPTSKATRP